jgi:hypothetical protein
MMLNLVLFLSSSSLSLAAVEEYAPVYQFTEILGVTCPQLEWDQVLEAMTNVTQDKPPQWRSTVRSAAASTPVATASAATVVVQRQLTSCPKWCGKYCLGMGCVSSLSSSQVNINATQNDGDEKQNNPDTTTLDPEQGNRLLGRSNADAPVAATVQRELLGCPKWCGKYCVQTANGCGTLDRRRRQLADNTKCSKAIADIDVALAKVVSKLSQPCRDILRDPIVSCPLFSTSDCYLTHFSVWNADSGQVLIPKMNATASTKICRSLGLISLRIETNFMVGPVTLVLYEVRTDKNEVRVRDSITERAAPYTIFGLRTSNSGQRVSLRGEVLNVGSYQLKATSDDNPTHTKTVSFTVAPC